MKSVEIRPSAGEYEKGRHFILDRLKESSIPKTMIAETMLVYEALYHNLTGLTDSGDTVLKLNVSSSFGDVRISIGFEGPMFDPLDDRGDALSPENRILSAYADKIGHSYHSGYNRISISVRRSYRQVMMSCFIAILLGIAAYALLHLAAAEKYDEFLLHEIVFPLETVFTNAILMIGAPVTFMSLIKNLTDVYILSERDSGIRRIQYSTLSTSVIAVLLAIVSAEIIKAIYTVTGMAEELTVTGNEEVSFSEFISSLVPPSIFEPFVTISPLPLIILAALFTYAFCSVGKFFDTLKTAVDAGYVLCSRVLSVIMSTLPFFVFTAILDLLLTYGIDGLINQLALFLIVLISLVIVAAFYAVRLKAGGVKVIPFVKDLIPLIYENFRINSVIDAVPFNVRYCARTYKFDRKKLESFLPVLAQINLDGNCYMLTLITLTLIFWSGTGISMLWVAAIGALVLFLSLGAPNQPGSCIIGMVIIFNFLLAKELLPLAILAEVFFGGLLNIINVIGDIVTVATAKER